MTLMLCIVFASSFLTISCNKTITIEPSRQAETTEELREQESDDTGQQQSNITVSSFYSKDADFILSFPLEATLSTNPMVSATEQDKILSITITKLEDIPQSTFFGYDKDTALKDSEELKQGNYGQDTDIPVKDSQKVLELDGINAKEFTVLSRADEIGITFERVLVFYNNGFQVIIDWKGNSEEITKDCKDYFTDSEINTSGIEWKKDNGKILYEDLYTKLSNGEAPEAAQDWFDAFDTIVSSIIFEPSIDKEITEGLFTSTVYYGKTDDKNNYIINNQYPDFFGFAKSGSLKKLSTAIKDIAGKFTEQFEDDVITIAQEDNQQLGAYNYLGGYAIANIDENMVSTYYSYYTFTGGAHGYNGISTYNFDVKNAKEIKLSGLFKDDFDYLKYLSDYSISFVKEKLDREGAVVDEEILSEGASPKEENYQHFLLTKDALIIKFEQYQVTPGAYGIITVLIPYSDFKNNINPDSVISNYIDV